MYTALVLRQMRDIAGMKLPYAGIQTMSAVAAKLTDAEIEALASYVNGLH